MTFFNRLEREILLPDRNAAMYVKAFFKKSVKSSKVP